MKLKNKQATEGFQEYTFESGSSFYGYPVEKIDDKNARYIFRVDSAEDGLYVTRRGYQVVKVDLGQLFGELTGLKIQHSLYWDKRERFGALLELEALFVPYRVHENTIKPV